jgi:hypothetical protein
MMAPFYNCREEYLYDEDSDSSTEPTHVEDMMEIPTKFCLLPRFFQTIPYVCKTIPYVCCKTIPYVCLFSLWWSLMSVVAVSFTVNQIVNLCHLGILRICAEIMEIMNTSDLNNIMQNRIRTITTGKNDTPYLTRFYLFIKHQQRGKIPFNIFFHKFLSTDDKNEMHDHPWNYFHIILSGGYWEHHFENDEESCTKTLRVWRGSGYWCWENSRHRHRIELEPGKPKPWTLVIPFKRQFHWGFWRKKNGCEWYEKIYHEKFLEKKEE